MTKILLVDDDQMNGKLLQTRLQKRGFDCEYVTSGKDCFELILKQQFDLVLLDIMMPEISGIDVLVKLRETYSKFDLPIIMVTAKDDALDIVDALNKDANDYLTKPVNIDVAIARIETQIQMKNLVHESLKAKQVNTINTMVTTLNHEINNPLAIAVANLSILYEKVDKDKVDVERIQKSLTALSRITDIVKKIEKISQGEMEETNYSGNVNMYKLK